MIADTLWNVAKDLFGIFTKLGDAKLQRTIRVSDYFTNLAQVIEDTSAYLKKGIYPHGQCEQLRTYAAMMAGTIGDLVGQHEADEYARKVMEVWEIERVHCELVGAPDADKARELRRLDEAAGYFRAIAAHLRVSM